MSLAGRTVTALSWGLPENPWWSGAVKALVFSAGYLVIQLSFEWAETRRMVSWIRRELGREAVQHPVHE